MAKEKIPYDNYYKVGQQVKIGIRLSGSLFRESSGEITHISGNNVKVEMLGGSLPVNIIKEKAQSRVLLSGWSGWGFFCCDALLKDSGATKEVTLALVGEIEERQRREYFRLDVVIPFLVDGEDTQKPSEAKERWNAALIRNRNSPPPDVVRSGKGYRAVTRDRKDLPPEAVNLSGGGMRFRMKSGVRIGNLLNLDLYLPLNPPRIVSAVGEVIRCNELTLRIQKDPVFVVAARFVHIEDKDRDALISFIFSEQRNQLKAEAEPDLIGL